MFDSVQDEAIKAPPNNRVRDNCALEIKNCVGQDVDSG